MMTCIVMILSDWDRSVLWRTSPTSTVINVQCLKPCLFFQVLLESMRERRPSSCIAGLVHAWSIQSQPQPGTIVWHLQSLPYHNVVIMSWTVWEDGVYRVQKWTVKRITTTRFDTMDLCRLFSIASTAHCPALNRTIPPISPAANPETCVGTLHCENTAFSSI